jgi:type II secretory pathway predicted ATPase ExeA
MYEAYYGFEEKPFSMLPDPDFLFLSKKHQAALTLLEYGLLNHVGFCVISGEPGAGKTTILRAILDRIGGDVTVGLITNTHQTFGGLLDWILSVFDLHKPDLTQVEMHQVFMDFLIDEYANNRTVLLIVDEAQNMNADSLEELRMLSNVNTEKDQLLQVVLAGQPALKEMLRKPELMQFAQRIAVDYHLDPLSLIETCGYIQHRLTKAGASKDVFSPRACQRIYEYSGGTPRLINLLCETVLVYGFADQKEMIDADMVDDMVQERMKDSVVPITSRDHESRDDPAVIEELNANFPHIGREEIEEVVADDFETVDDSTVEPAATEQPGTEQSSPEVQTSEAKTPEKKEPERITPESKELEPKELTPQLHEDKEVAQEFPDLVEGKPARAKRGSGKSTHVSPSSVATDKKAADNAKSATDKTSAKTDKSSAKKPATRITGQTIPSAVEKTDDSTRKQLVIYGGLAAVIGFILIMLAMFLDEDFENQPASTQEKNTIKQEILQQDETKRLIEEKLEASRLANEKAEADRLAAEKEAAVKQEAEKQAIEKQLLEEANNDAARKEAGKAEALRKEQIKKEQAQKDKVKQEQLLREEKERIAHEKQAAIEKRKAREAKYEAERARRKAEKLEQERILKEQEEAHRLQQEWIEEERKALEKKQ